MERVKCKVDYCKENTGDSCGLSIIAVNENSECAAMVPKFEKDLKGLQMEVESCIATCINKFKQRSGFSLRVLNVEVVFEESAAFGTARVESIIQDIRVHSEVIV